MDFYDALAPLYHLIFPDWSNGIQRQGEELDRVIQSEWPGLRTVLDVSCGIGTQTLALAGRGYSVVGSDLSAKEIERARREADLRGLVVDLTVGDMRAAHETLLARSCVRDCALLERHARKPSRQVLCEHGASGLPGALARC